MLVVVSIATALVGALTRHLLPLAALLRMSLVFPGPAPSRPTLAARSLSRRLARRISDDDLGRTPNEAAANVLAVMCALGRHDRRTRGHSERVQAYADLVGAELGLPQADQEKLTWAALVHDIGKIHAQPSLLNKPGQPSAEEWEEIRHHPADAKALLAPLRPWLGEWLDAATQHHERFDGAGYPAGRHGHQIALAARIVAVVDAYDTMTSARAHRRPLRPGQARLELRRCTGTQFDPDVVRAFLRVPIRQVRYVTGPAALVSRLTASTGLLTITPARVRPAIGAALVGGTALLASTTTLAIP